MESLAISSKVKHMCKHTLNTIKPFLGIYLTEMKAHYPTLMSIETLMGINVHRNFIITPNGTTQISIVHE